MYLTIQNFCISKHRIVPRRYIISLIQILWREGIERVFKKILLVCLMALWVLSGPLMGNALADPAKTPAMDVDGINTGDTAWMLMSSALVLLMTPGLAFFYGGLVRSRNVLNTMMMSLVLMAPSA